MNEGMPSIFGGAEQMLAEMADPAAPPAPRRFWALLQTAEPWRLDDCDAELPAGATVWTELALSQIADCARLASRSTRS